MLVVDRLLGFRLLGNFFWTKSSWLTYCIWVCRNGNTSENCQIVYLDGPPAYEKTGPVFGSVWNGILFQGEPEPRRPMAQSSAIDLLNAVVFDEVKCSGSLCKYDPPNLPPGKLTCQDDPCPKGQDCCAYYQSFTCCAIGQNCVGGFCQ